MSNAGTGQESTDKRALLPSALGADVIHELGPYVYLLVDPRDGFPFYVGKGRGNRVYQHVWAVLAGAAIRGEGSEIGGEGGPSVPKAVVSAKEQRIREIYAAGQAVEHHIVRKCASDAEALAVEHGIISTLRIAGPRSEYGPLANVVAGHYAFNIADTRAEEIALRLGAEKAPELPRPCLVLKVNAAGQARDTTEIYKAARSAWAINSKARQVVELPVFVVAHDVVRAVFLAEKWDSLERGNGKKGVVWEFDGRADAELEEAFVGKRLRPADFGFARWAQQGKHFLRHEQE